MNLRQEYFVITSYSIHYTKLYEKISEKKNWGPASKGMSANILALDSFSEGGALDRFHIASFMRRDDELHAYGLDSPAVEYSYFHETLLNWIVDKMNNQQDEGPAEDIAQLLAASGYPTQAIISIGATRYTEFGEKTFLQPGDESIVIVYDATLYSPDVVKQMAQKSEYSSQGMSVLSQQVV